nr:MAG TPA: hypothetical protein [Caudoviricetes sp.]
MYCFFNFNHKKVCPDQCRNSFNPILFRGTIISFIAIVISICR